MANKKEINSSILQMNASDTQTGEWDNLQPYAYWLGNINGVGRATAKKLLEVFASPMEVYSAGEKALSQVVNSTVAEAIIEAQKQEIRALYEALLEKNIRFIPFYHPDYSKRLQDIPDAPYALYVKGELPADDKRSVAIVGARNCSAYGRYVAETFAKELARQDIQIVSGLAAGVDGLAQNAAIEAGGQTYGVLGCGVDICYPAYHKPLYEKVIESGGMISTYPPGRQPQPVLFPPRNRIISGLSDVVLVVEARKKSGTLITVDMALEQGREVYVVPGRITDRLSDGCNNLLCQGAGAALSPEQFMQELEETVWREEGEKTKTDKNSASQKNPNISNIKSSFNAKMQTSNLLPQEKALLSLLDFYPISLDQIYMTAQTTPILCELTLSQMMEMLLLLSMQGFVNNEGGYYMLKKPV
ncbi:MAG: DNA-processing protein DprA [Lachnospiraceae bacterium]|nr:DNA-processing protein DprA [Lachnospiraceae bacterium]